MAVFDGVVRVRCAMHAKHVQRQRMRGIERSYRLQCCYNWKGTFRGEGVLDLRGYRERMEALYGARMPESKGAAFFDILRKSERPLIYAGGGVMKSDASRDLRPIATSIKITDLTPLERPAA